MAVNHIKKMASWIILAIFFVAIDRFFKTVAFEYDQTVNIAGSLLRFNFAKNYNIAFSLPITGIILNIFISVIIIILLFWALRLYSKKENGKIILISFLILGAASNLIDRLRFGYVIDYLDLKYFTVFNIADMMIVASVGGLLILYLGLDKNKEV